MNTNTNNAAMDGRLPQFHGGQGLVSGYGGLAGNMLTLQNLQGAAAAGYGLQTQIQAGRYVATNSSKESESFSQGWKLT